MTPPIHNTHQSWRGNAAGRDSNDFSIIQGAQICRAKVWNRGFQRLQQISSEANRGGNQSEEVKRRQRGGDPTISADFKRGPKFTEQKDWRSFQQIQQVSSKTPVLQSTSTIKRNWLLGVKDQMSVFMDPSCCTVAGTYSLSILKGLYQKTKPKTKWPGCRGVNFSLQHKQTWSQATDLSASTQGDFQLWHLLQAGP